MAKPTNVLILGNAADNHSNHLHQALTDAGATVDYFDTRRFPTQLQISWEIDRHIGHLNLSPELSVEISRH